MFICYGEQGNNGKSTLLEAVHRLLGELAQMTEFDIISSGKGDNFVRAEIAQLISARFVSMNEAKSVELNESLVKQLTGGDTITGRHLFKKSIKFLPQFKIWLRANEKPEIRGSENAIWRRMMVIPFTKSIPVELRKPRHMIDRELDAEKEGIFAWLVEGARIWYDEGLNPPEAVLLSNKEYREESDYIALFLREVSKPGQTSEAARCEVIDLYKAYRNWTKDNGMYTLNAVRFGKEISRRGYEGVTSNDIEYWLGITLKDSAAATVMF